MEIIRDPNLLQQKMLALRQTGKQIGLVPTMGFLHEGHLSLIRAARSQCDVLVVSIFVNPTQFGPNEDLNAYPRDFESDEQRCKEEGTDIVFYPSAQSMYSEKSSVWVNETILSHGLCGASRSGHFRGVCTVVAKLFNLVQPSIAVFGEKDAQQLRIIEQMVRDLFFPIKIIRAPLVREPDGLAMSSRNKYLSKEERNAALCLQSALHLATNLFENGERSTAVLREAITLEIKKTALAKIDYIEIVDDQKLTSVEEIKSPVLIALAVKFGKTRLIDNQYLFFNSFE